jgi:hypothetical protein
MAATIRTVTDGIYTRMINNHLYQHETAPNMMVHWVARCPNAACRALVVAVNAEMLVRIRERLEVTQ